MFREIRGLQQRRTSERRRWFQDPYFDLFLIEDGDGHVFWFQLCYARDTWRERVLEWRRGRGFQHLRVRDRDNPIRKDTGELVLDGILPYAELSARLASTGGLPQSIAAFVAAKLDEYARPARRFRPLNAKTPRWLERLRTAQRLRFLDSGHAGR